MNKPIQPLETAEVLRFSPSIFFNSQVLHLEEGGAPPQPCGTGLPYSHGNFGTPALFRDYRNTRSQMSTVLAVLKNWP
jgi:hypothetical protein